MFLITLKQVGILLGYILLGYFLCRKNVIEKETSKAFSKLLLYVFTPAYTIPNLINGLDISYIKQYIFIFLAGAILTGVIIFLAIPISKMFSKDAFEVNIYKYMFTFSNLGYFGYPLVKEVFGAETLANFILFCLPISIAINSYGYFILTIDESEKSKFDKKALRRERLKRTFSFPFFTVVLGIILGLLPITYPEIFFDVLEPAGNCYSVSAMIIAGISLSSYSFKELFLSVKPYLASLARLLIIPALLGGAFFGLYKLFDFDKIILICVVSFAVLPSGMNVVVFPEFAGKDGSIGAKACFISYILALATVPLWFYLLSLV